MPLELSTPVQFIKRIGDRVAANLAERGVLTVEDLLYHLPFRYEDRLHPRPLSLYQPGDMASLIGEVRGTTLLRTRSSPIFEMTVGIRPPNPTAQNPSPSAQDLDSETWVSRGSPPATPSNITTNRPSPSAQDLETVKCMWFHGTYLKDKFRPGQTIALYGKLEASRSGTLAFGRTGSTSPAFNRFKMIQPTFEILPDAHATGEDAEFIMLEMGRIVPVYESLGGTTPWGAKLTSRWTRRVLWTVFRDLTEPQTLTPLPATRRAPSTSPTNPGVTTTLGAPHLDSEMWVSRESPPATSPNPTTRSLPPSAPNAQNGETIPTALRLRLNLPTRMEALQALHFPPAGTPMTELMSARTPAHRRLIFEEFWYLELGLELKRRRLRERRGTAFVANDQVREALKQVLPFKPTAAQKRVLGEIVTDMRSTQPMRRLLQGDVGSGKTIVAFQAALVAIENGTQVALMAPTEILATQHYLSARKLLGDKLSPRTKRPYRIALLTGSLDDRAKRETRNRIFRGEVDLAIGTHALVEDNVDFANLGLVIVDEQHRFGVQQRFQLMRKPNAGTATRNLSEHPTSPGAPGLDSETWVSRKPSSPATPNPATQSPPPSAQDPSTPYPLRQDQVPRGFSLGSHSPEREGALSPEVCLLKPAPSTPGPNSADEPDVLVMTATPIPRTLALTVYGDLDVSVIDELPPGRSPILTRRMPGERSAEVWDFVRKQVSTGHQVYIVYPVIEGATDDQPELDFAPCEEDPSQKPAASETGKPGTIPSAGGALYTSVGRSPTKAPKMNQRAGGPTYKPTKTARAKTPNRPKLRSATEMHDELQQGPLKGLKLGLLHGRMSADEKEITMARFKRGEIDVLVSTTVIEVGVDVPNATLMIIEHAERFGLAQMHQLRGRVGRGAAKSFCVLLTGAAVSPEAELRLDAMVRTQNGFELAEVDLQQRGPGEFFGTRQAGLPEFRVANLARDRDLLELAKLEAARFVHAPDPSMPRPEIDAVWSRLKHQWQRRYGLVEA